MSRVVGKTNLKIVKAFSTTGLTVAANRASNPLNQRRMIRSNMKYRRSSKINRTTKAALSQNRKTHQRSLQCPRSRYPTLTKCSRLTKRKSLKTRRRRIKENLEKIHKRRPKWERCAPCSTSKRPKKGRNLTTTCNPLTCRACTQ